MSHFRQPFIFDALFSNTLFKTLPEAPHGLTSLPCHAINARFVCRGHAGRAMSLA
jgi:hypothetical protein